MSENTIKLSVVIITFNEEKNINRCLESCKNLADEILVVDSFSKDRTKEICLHHEKVKFIEHEFKGHIEQKNYAISLAKFPYILSLDADEALSEKLFNSISEIKKNFQADGYTFNRLTNYCGKWIKHCGWYPDKKLRLWDSRKGRWKGTNPHDKFVLQENSETLHLDGDLLHYSYNSISEHISQINKFSDIKAKMKFKENQKASVSKIFFSTIIKFKKHYFLKLGFLDGYYGFVVSVNAAYYNFATYTKLRELNKKQLLN